MSGIAGVIRLDGAPVARGDTDAMLASMARRGPDQRRGWCGASASIGQALLATTPEAVAELQPWVHPESGCVVVSDSRLDNRPELLSALGITRSAPDTIGDGELLHAAWQRWGEGCAEHLLGDFAFAIWDARNRQLYCARDVMGVRPFYYHFAPGRLFAFASEIGALLTLRDVPKEINEGRIADALVAELEGIDRTSTFYQALVRLPPAQTLQLKSGAPRLREYWQPMMHRPSTLPTSETEWIEALHDVLQQSVHRRLRGSQRVGSMLSGGLDSSSVVALASALLRAEGRGRLPTFSAINSRGDCPETRAVRSMLRAFDMDATTIDVQWLDRQIPALRESLDHLAEPFDGAMLLISAQYHAASARGVRCLMDGMPADNLYTTSGCVQQMARRGQWRRAYRQALGAHRSDHRKFAKMHALKNVIGAWAPAAVRRLRQRQGDRASFDADLMGATLIHRDFARRVRLWDRYRKYRADMAETNVWAYSGQAMSSMTAAYVTAAVERYGRMAAYYGVEPRHPFLDQRVIEFHAWLPVAFRAREAWPKWALRRAMRKTLPPDVAWRPDKEHLGQLFNMAVIGPHCENVDAQTVRAVSLGNYLDPGKLEAATRAWRERRDSQAFDVLHSAALVGWWLERHPSPG